METEGEAQGKAQGPASPTLNRRIRADIEAKILSGEWGPGHRIPYEHELMAQYGCARMTVNKVVSELAAAGLVERRRRAGSFVAAPRIQSAILQIPDIEAEVTARGEAYRYELLRLERRPASRAAPVEWELAPRGRVLEIECRHMAGSRPFALERRLINISAVPEAEAVDFARQSPSSWLVTHVPWTAAEHKITAVNAVPEMAKLLDIPDASACLELQRRTWRGDENITTVRQTFRGDLFDLIARFTPAQASGGG
ncbi:histidine utilization repressor [Xanthobacter sp. KR7-225]|uniref:histidine utilization repressor n=1 Tax=Xanthobacter sp. KR7-225 TaxID=3156613 RepID=UPI0032B553E5